MILLITNERDVTCDLVVILLRDLGIDFVRMNTENFLSHADIAWRFGTTEDTGIACSWNEHRIDPSKVQSVWYRRPIAPLPPSGVEDPDAVLFLKQEANSYLRNFYGLISGFWVSGPQAIQRAEQKLVQLRLASELKLTIPATLVSNRPDDVRAFAAFHQQIIAKPISSATIREASVPAHIYANALGASDFDRLDELTCGLVLFQKQIPKLCDLRVTVVGTRCFAVEIHSAPVPESPDWRRLPSTSLRYTLHHLPYWLEERILALVKTFDLQFSALDFIITPSGEYIFLELNPNGQWAWIEQMTGVPIARALVDLLSGTDASL